MDDDTPCAEYIDTLAELAEARFLLTSALDELAVANELIRRYAATDARLPAGATPAEYEHLQEVIRG